MAPVIYTSTLVAEPLVKRSIFTHLFSSNDTNTIGGFPVCTPAYTDAATGITLTRGQTKQLALSLAYGLKNQRSTSIHAKRGDAVLVYSSNSLAWPVVLLGTIAAGLRCSPANNAYNARELTSQCIDSGAKLIFSNESGVPTAREALVNTGLSKTEADQRIIVISSGLEWAGGPSTKADNPGSEHLLTLADLLKLGSLEEEEKFEGDAANETFLLCYSSGTTGKPKGVETTHRNLTTTLGMLHSATKLNYKDDSVLGFLPFYHIFGAMTSLWSFSCGVPVVIMTHFDPVLFCAYVERYKITMVSVVPPILIVLARHPAVDQYDLSSLSLLAASAAPLGAALTWAVIDRLQLQPKRKGKKPVKIVQGFGMTEASPSVHLVPEADAERKIGSVGVLLPHLELRLVVDGDGNGDIDALEGQPGEIWLRGPSIMKGYLNNPTATKEAITPDGWYKTGDIGTRDSEGFYYIIDRRKELIKYKGFQVSPAELESVLLTHPYIADAAVIGVDSQKEATELPRAYVIHANPDNVKTDPERAAFSESVERWMRSNVARHKYLRGGVVIIEAIPKSAAGKILRRELRERAKMELAGRDPSDDNIRGKL